jgi:hypothetical protein
MVEYLTVNQGVVGSSPTLGAKFKNASIAQLVELLICNQGVIGSIPVTGSKLYRKLAQSGRAHRLGR